VAESRTPTGRNLVLCLDGTSNEPETGATNVVRLYEVAKKTSRQFVYYDPGVGTMGARGAITPLGRKLTRAAGLIAGYGVKDNVEEAYVWLAENYRFGDRIFVFGFSRGAYTARALTGMLRTVGLIRPGAQNLAPYALKLYAQSKTAAKAIASTPPELRGSEAAIAAKRPEADRAFWATRDAFIERFGNPAFPNPFDPSRAQIEFLGVWDTVKSVGWLNWKAKIEQTRWPFTARITNVRVARHAMSIDERRRTFPVYRFDGRAVGESEGRYKEAWFAGIHSDVGGQYPDDHRLSDVAFDWMVAEARACGLLIDDKALARILELRKGPPIADRAFGKVHPNGWYWWLLGGWRSRVIRDGDELHESVWRRIAADATYSPRLPEGMTPPEGRGG
jgi:uncharacterized protein (DUF2235 family)